MKCSLGISDFLEEIASLSHSVVFLYFFALIAEGGFLNSSCYSLEICIQMGRSSLFSPCFLLLFFSSLSITSEYSGMISFRMDWLDLLSVQGTLKSLLQHQSLKASILLHSAFFIVQLSHPYMTTGKTIALTRLTFVSEVMSLLFNILSKLVMTFLPRSKHLLISWLQPPSAVILESKK